MLKLKCFENQILRHTRSPILGLRVYFLSLLLIGLLGLSGCGVFSTRPDRPLAYAEAALLGAARQGAEGFVPQNYQLARETLYRARSAYRLKNFREARRLAIRARILAEEAEFKAIHRDSDPRDNPTADTEQL